MDKEEPRGGSLFGDSDRESDGVEEFTGVFHGTRTDGEVARQLHHEPIAVLYENPTLQWDSSAVGAGGWTNHNSRRSKHYGTVDYTYGRGRAARTLYSNPMTAKLRAYGQAVMAICNENGMCLTEANFQQCLVNEYRAGGNIPWHSDDEEWIDQTKPIISLSFLGNCTFRVRNIHTKRVLSKAIGNGDIAIMPAGFQEKWLHCTVGTEARRISLTWRTAKEGYGNVSSTTPQEMAGGEKVGMQPAEGTSRVDGTASRRLGRGRSVGERDRKVDQEDIRGLFGGDIPVAGPSEPRGRVNEQHVVAETQDAPAREIRAVCSSGNRETMVPRECPGIRESGMESDRESESVDGESDVESDDGSEVSGGLGGAVGGFAPEGRETGLGGVFRRKFFSSNVRNVPFANVDAPSGARKADVRWWQFWKRSSKPDDPSSDDYVPVIIYPKAKAVPVETQTSVEVASVEAQTGICVDVSTQVYENKPAQALTEGKPTSNRLPFNWEKELEAHLRFKSDGAPRTPSMRKMLSYQAYDFLKKYDMKAAGLDGTSDLADSVQQVIDKVASCTKDVKFMYRLWDKVDVYNRITDFYTKGIIRTSYLNKWFAFLLSLAVAFVLYDRFTTYVNAFVYTDEGYFPVGARELFAQKNIYQNFKVRFQMRAEPMADVKWALASIEFVIFAVRAAGYSLLCSCAFYQVCFVFCIYYVGRYRRRNWDNIQADLIAVLPSLHTSFIACCGIGLVIVSSVVGRAVPQAIECFATSIHDKWSVLWWFFDRDWVAWKLGYEWISRAEMLELTSGGWSHGISVVVSCYLVSLIIVYRVDCWVERVMKKGN